MAVTVTASKSNISSSTTAESKWVTVYQSSGDLDWWYLQVYAEWAVIKSGSTYKVSPIFYIRVKTFSGDLPSTSAVLEAEAMSGGKRTGFDTLGVASVFSSKRVSAISTDKTTLGKASAASKDVSGTYTDTTSSGNLLYYIKLKVTNGVISESVNVNFEFDGSFYGTKIKIKTWDIAYYANSDFGGNYIDGKPVQDGKSYTVIKAPTRTFDDLTFNYYVSFNTNGGIPSQETRDRSISQSRTYRFDSWSGVAPGTILTAHSDRNFTEQYHIDYSQLTYKTIGSLPTVSKKGYIKTNEWYYSNGNIASSSDEVKNSFTLSCKWTPQNYKIKFSFDLNGGQMPEDMGKISEYEIFKTYGINSDATKTPNFTPVKLGYKFIGWSDKTKSIPPIGANSSNQGVSVSIPDSFYNAVNTEFTNNDVTLYAYWEYNPNKLICNYYLNDVTSDIMPQPEQDIKYFNIDTVTDDGQKAVLKYAPLKLRSGDYVFLGWCNKLPAAWKDKTMKNKGYCGTYAVPPEKVVDEHDVKINIELPIKIDISKLKSLEDWGGEYQYYGIWAKTGKSIMINGSWKKVNKCFVKIDGSWKTVTDIWTCTNIDPDTGKRTWQHEI